MKTASQWANLLPAKFRQEVMTLYDREQDLGVETMNQYLSKIMGDHDNFISSRNDWESLSRSYMKGQDRDFHISYKTVGAYSGGTTIRALDIQHALDIFNTVTGMTEDDIIYLQPKEREKPKEKVILPILVPGKLEPRDDHFVVFSEETIKAIHERYSRLRNITITTETNFEAFIAEDDSHGFPAGSWLFRTEVKD